MKSLNVKTILLISIIAGVSLCAISISYYYIVFLPRKEEADLRQNKFENCLKLVAAYQDAQKSAGWNALNALYDGSPKTAGECMDLK